MTNKKTKSMIMINLKSASYLQYRVIKGRTGNVHVININTVVQHYEYAHNLKDIPKHVHLFFVLGQK